MIPTTFTIANKTSNYNLLESESGDTVFTNFGAVGTITFFLPEDAPNGTYYIFSLGTAQGLRIDPGTGTIRDTSNSSLISDKYIWADAAGETITLISNGINEWYTMTKGGFWSTEV